MRLVAADFEQYPVQDFQFNAECAWTGSYSRKNKKNGRKAFSLSFFSKIATLTRIAHQLPTAAVDPGMSTALRSVGLLDILSSMSAGPSKTYIFTLGAKRQAPCLSAPPRYGTR